MSVCPFVSDRKLDNRDVDDEHAVTLVSVLDSISHRFSLRISTFSSSFSSSLLPKPAHTLVHSSFHRCQVRVVGCLLPLLVGNVRVSLQQFLLFRIDVELALSLDRVPAQSRGFHSSSLRAQYYL